MTKLPEFSLHTKETAPEESKALLDMAEQQFGFVPNVLRQMAEAPSAFGSNLQMFGLYGKSSLSLEEQWVVLLVMSRYCTANYCVAANSTVAQMLGVSSNIVDAVRRGEAIADAKLETLRHFTDEMIQNTGFVSEETKERFFDAGFTKANLFDVILGIALETMASYTARSTGTPMDEQFMPNVWEPNLAS